MWLGSARASSSFIACGFHRLGQIDYRFDGAILMFFFELTEFVIIFWFFSYRNVFSTK